MTNLDQIIKDYKTSRSLESFDSRADEILTSLSNQFDSGLYLTERQALLAVNLLTKNSGHLIIEKSLLEHPQWEKPFRIVVKPQYVKFNQNNETNKTYVELAYSANKKSLKKFEDLRKKMMPHIVTKIKKSVWQFSYNEITLHDIVTFALEEKITVDPIVLEVYNKICEIKTQKNENLFYIEKTNNDNLIKKVKEEVGDIVSENILLEDRKIAFQYQIFDSFFEKKPQKNLVEKIATRKKPTIFLSKTNYKLDQIISCLNELKRFPALIIFDGSPEKSSKNLEILSTALEQNNLTENVGIYFRHDNSEIGKPFNEFVAQKAYNKPLNNLTEVVGITNVKIPKFLLKMKWQPKSVIVLCQTLGSNRVNLFTEYCDLVIYYQDKKPLKASIEEIV
jgi:hypothetical protein